MKVVDPTTKNPALGANRLVSGICGAPIRETALHFIRSARKAIDKEQLNLTVIGCGGITTKEHFTEFVNAGATVAMTATGMMWDPYLALRYHNE
jgi:dihydroorotate dehydrogenase (NAD+) catalytic subunit